MLMLVTTIHAMINVFYENITNYLRDFPKIQHYINPVIKDITQG